MSFSLCGTLELPSINFICSGKKKKKKKQKCTKHVSAILDDIDNLLSHQDFDRDFLSDHLLSKIIQLSASEFGFIGQVDDVGDNIPRLFCYAISNIRYNSSSGITRGDEIPCFQDPFFKSVFSTGKSIFVNKFPVSHTGNTHPLYSRVLCIPITVGKRVVGMVCLCNKFEAYSKHDQDNVEQVIKTLAYLLFIIGSEIPTTPNC